MSRKRLASGADDPWLSPAQQRVWLAWMRIGLRMDYEINRELQEQGDLSHPDYHVLVALSNAQGGRLQLTDLANTIGWERSRVSHHLQRMTGRGLTRRVPSATDRRATDAVLTPAGRRALEKVAPQHAMFIRDMFFGELAEEELPTFAGLLEQVYDGILERGSLPPPPISGTVPASD
jgi:DNA-binding MarR family transcriptional regulator